MRQENRLQANSAGQKKYKIKTNRNIDKGNIYVDVEPLKSSFYYSKWALTCIVVKLLDCKDKEE